MKLKGLVTAALVTSLAAGTLASPLHLPVKKPFRNAHMVMMHEREEPKDYQDLINILETKKQKIREAAQKGEITQEQADAKIARIDEKIKAVNEFQTLSLPEKKETLIAHYKARLDKKVEAGKLEQSEADQRLKEFTERVEKWDGTGFPFSKRHR